MKDWKVGDYYRVYTRGKPDMIIVTKVIKSKKDKSAYIKGKRVSNNSIETFRETGLFEKISPQTAPEYFL